MKNHKRINQIGLTVSMILYIVYVVCMFMFHPLVASAAEQVPGGFGNKVVVSSIQSSAKDYGDRQQYHVTAIAGADSEIVGYLSEYSTVPYISLNLVVYKKGSSSYYAFNNLNVKPLLSDYVGAFMRYDDGTLTSSTTYTLSSSEGLPTSFWYRNKNDESYNYNCVVSGCKIFSGKTEMENYIKNGSLDGMLKDETDKSWYLKNVDYKVDADDSPTSEAGEDATYITFTWDTDNLQEGDLLEIKTHNYLKKIGGDQISGFHDYITWSNSVSAYSGEYRFSQYDATKAWFQTLDNKPLIFKSYDTDIYYLRPYRNGVSGGWVKITMGRSSAIKGSPYVEDIEYGDFDEDDEWVTDEALTEENGGHHGIDQNGNIFYPDTSNPFEGTNVAGIFSWFFDFFRDIPSLLGELPALVGQVVGFLPSPVIGFIALGIIVAIILRIVGR